jgi:hypothetical protein
VTTQVQPGGGVDAFIADVSRRAAHFSPNGETTRFILEIGEAYACIRLQDVRRPAKFLSQMAQLPPVQFGTEGFRPNLVDDDAPARHYTAFVFVGYWLPRSLGGLVLWMWEILGFIRYGGEWSAPDIRMGRVGLRHGRLIRRNGAAILPSLIARDLAAAPDG